MATSIAKLEELTVIILSRERQHCLQKVIPFWEKHGIRTLIVDQSRMPLYKDILGSLKIGQYIHLDRPFRERCKKVLEYLDTKYSIVISDDELYIPTALIEMMGILEDNPDLVSVGGMALSIWRYGPQICGSWPYQATAGYINDEGSSLGRVQRHTNYGMKSVTTFLTSNLTRTEQIRDCFRLYAKSPIISTEASSSFAICSAGRFKYVDVLYWIRNWNEPPRSNTGWDRTLMIHDWWPNRKLISPDTYSDFESELEAIYRKYSSSENYNLAWSLILSASKQVHLEHLPYSGKRQWHQLRILTFLKFMAKWMVTPSKLPQRYQQTLLEMRGNGVKVDFIQSGEAIEIVSNLFPYKNWK